MYNNEMICIENFTQHHFIKWFSLDGIIERYKKEEIVEGHTLGEPVTRVSGRKQIFSRLQIIKIYGTYKSFGWGGPLKCIFF